MKRVLTLLFSAALLISLVGCGEWEESQNDLYETLAGYYGTTEKQDQFPSLTSFALPYLPDETADPITCLDGAQKTLGTLIYESLLALDAAFEPQLLLAESCVGSDDGRVYTVTVRKGILFSDGTELTARDVVYSINRARSSQRYGARLADITSVSGSDYTVTIQLSRSNTSFAARLDIPIIKNGTGSRTWPIGTGPYYYLNEEGGAHLALNPHWWQGSTLPLQRIELVRCKDSDTMSYAFYAREIQLLMCDLTSTSTSNVYGSGIYTDAATTTMQFIGINTARAELNNAALRQALSLGIDRQGCIDAFLLGHGLAAQSPLSPVSALYPDGLDVAYSPYHFDTAMSEGGYSDGDPISLTLLVNQENSFKVDAAHRIAEDLSHHDLTVTVRVLPWEEYLLALQSGNYDLYYGECRLTADWELRALVGTGGSLNYGSYSNAETDALLDAYLRAPQSQRAEAMEALCRHLAQEAPLLPICFKNVSVLLPAGVVGPITPTATNPFYDLASWEIDIVQ